MLVTRSIGANFHAMSGARNIHSTCLHTNDMVILELL